MLDLRRPIYKQTAAYGHFGRNDLKLPWEALDKVEALKKYLQDLFNLLSEGYGPAAEAAGLFKLIIV